MKKFYLLVGFLSCIAFIIAGEDKQIERNIPRDGLVAEWLFDGNADDTSGRRNDGESHGASLTEDRLGKPNQAYQFNGKDSYISVPHAASLDYAGQLTVSVWMNMDSYSWMTSILSKYDGNGPKGYDVSLFSREPCFSVFSSRTQWGNSAGMLVDSGRWYHIVGVVQKNEITSKDVTRIYLNGELRATADKCTCLPNGMDLLMGLNYIFRGQKTFFSGSLDDIRIYDRCLDESEIRRLYDEGGYAGKTVRETSTAEKGLAILKAEYGANASWLDVSAQLSVKLKNDRLSMFASSDIAGDPAYGSNKKLWIEYLYDGVKASKLIQDGQYFELPEKVDSPAEGASGEAASEREKAVSFFSYEKAPKQFDAWSFFWRMPHIDKNVKMRFSVFTSGKEEFYLAGFSDPKARPPETVSPHKPSQFKESGSNPGGGLPILIRWRKIFFTSAASVMTARIRIGEPQEEQVRGSVS